MSGRLSVLAPIPIVGSMFVSSTLAESDYSPYSAGTTYAVGTRCISTSTHRIYESAINSNIGKDPTDPNNSTGDTAPWIDIGPTNKWALFDGEVNTQSTGPSPMTFVVRPGAFNCFYLGGLDAEGLTYTVKDAPGGNVILTGSSPLEGSAPADYYEYFFDRFQPATDFLLSGVDMYAQAEITITLTRASGNVKCGIFAMGDLRPLGDTQRGAKAKPKTYSYINTDKFGKTQIVRRKATTDMSASAFVDMAEANYVLDTLKEVLDVPCVWVGTDLPDYSGLRCFGLGSGELSYDYPKLAQLSLNVQGLI
jgi:hypothetical protein